MKPTQKGFVFFAIEELSSCEGNSFGWTAIRTNREGKVLSIYTTQQQEFETSPMEKVKKFREWMIDILEYKIVGLSHEQFNRFILMLEKEYPQIFPRHINRLLKSQYWNLMSELCYKFKMPDTTTVKDFLFFYGHHEMSHPLAVMQECLNVMELTKLYVFDKERTKKLCKRDLPNAYREVYRHYSIEKLLEECLQRIGQMKMEKLANGTVQIEATSPLLTTPFVIVHDNLRECLLQTLLQFHLQKK